MSTALSDCDVRISRGQPGVVKPQLSHMPHFACVKRRYKFQPNEKIKNADQLCFGALPTKMLCTDHTAWWQSLNHVLWTLNYRASLQTALLASRKIIIY